jgi:hypothetical protein
MEHKEGDSGQVEVGQVGSVECVPHDQPAGQQPCSTTSPSNPHDRRMRVALGASCSPNPISPKWAA